MPLRTCQFIEFQSWDTNMGGTSEHPKRVRKLNSHDVRSCVGWSSMVVSTSMSYTKASWMICLPLPINANCVVVQKDMLQLILIGRLFVPHFWCSPLGWDLWRVWPRLAQNQVVHPGRTYKTPLVWTFWVRPRWTTSVPGTKMMENHWKNAQTSENPWENPNEKSHCVLGTSGMGNVWTTRCLVPLRWLPYFWTSSACQGLSAVKVLSTEIDDVKNNTKTTYYLKN